MDKTIINLRSWSRAGKTTAFKKLGFLLTGEQCPDNEIKEILTYRGIKVGIFSLGDYREAVEQRLEELIENQCEVIFCASRTKGGTAVYVDQAAAEHGYIEIIIGSIWSNNPDNREICNTQLSVTLKELLDKLIDNA